jgi:hypothetical protein
MQATVFWLLLRSGARKKCRDNYHTVGMHASIRYLPVLTARFWVSPDIINPKRQAGKLRNQEAMKPTLKTRIQNSVDPEIDG